MKTMILFTCCFCILFFSCKKESFITSSSAKITVGADTLKFDTLFTTTGSTYQFFIIRNDNSQKLRLSSVKLMGGSSSVYKINVDGASGTQFNDIEINANDSVLVFVQASINQSATNLPFILRDSIEIGYNGNTRKVQLEAWGQNAHFFRDKIITGNETWLNDKPYVILGALLVDISSTLTIEKGCRIFIHADAPIVVDGSLKINGLKDTADRVYFTGDRLDAPYKDYPASWPGIFIRNSSADNVFTYAVIKNAYQAIGITGLAVNANPKLVLDKCIIDNAYDAGIIAVNSNLIALNSLISNCGKNISINLGGDYQFIHCTVATYANRFIEHKNSVLNISNAADNQVATLNAIFRNCIFWGENGLPEDEVQVNKTGNSVFNVLFENNLWKVKTIPANITSTNTINNQPPLFDSINSSRNYYDFRLMPGSPAINKGVPTSLLTDLDGNPRAVGLPDIGCFEKQ